MVTPNGCAGENVASYVVDLVVALGSDTAFSLVGGMAMHINRAVGTHPKLKAVYCQHEQACVAAAEGYAKASDFRRAGFAVITAGPGVSNSVTSLISAYGDSTPLIVLAGQIKTADIDKYSTRTHGVQEIRSADLIRPCVKQFIRITRDSMREQLTETLAETFSGRPGPVFIEIPLDVQGMHMEYSSADIAEHADIICKKVTESVCADGAAELTKDLAELLRSKRPLLYVGNGCRIAGVEACVRRFIEAHQIPAVFSWLSLDILPAAHPLYFGCPGGLAPIYSNEILGRADTIVFLGARLDLGTTAYQRDDFGAQAARYFVDIDFERTREVQRPAEQSLRQSGSSRIAASDSGHLVGHGTCCGSRLGLWCVERRAAYLAEERSRLASDKMNVYRIAVCISAWSTEKVFVSASSGYAEETFTRFFTPGENTRFFNGAALGSMGLGLPHAIGASFGTTRQVICLEADGGVMLNIQELATVVTQAPRGLVLFVLNNGGYESIRASQQRYFGSFLAPTPNPECIFRISPRSRPRFEFAMSASRT